MISSPPSLATQVTEDAGLFCRRLAESHYENFSVASRMLPKELRRHFYHIYAFCRWSDDLADESESPESALEKLSAWQEELDACFAGRPSHPITIALGETIRQFALKQAPFNDLLSAFRQDQSVTRYDTEEQLLDYCRRSADPVGRILLALAKVESPKCLTWSDSICTGLQLANFCQDMSRDAAIGRIYLPRSRWTEHHINEAMLLNRTTNSNLEKAALAWCSDIAESFHRGWELSRHVPAWLARDVRLFIGGGLTILDKIAAAGGDVWTERIEVGKWDKLKILARAVLTGRPPRRRDYLANTQSRSQSRV